MRDSKVGWFSDCQTLDASLGVLLPVDSKTKNEIYITMLDDENAAAEDYLRKLNVYIIDGADYKKV